MEADLQRFYGLPLAGLTTGELTWRRLGVLVRHLPREAASVRAQHGEQTWWGDSEYLLAVIADLLAGANWQRANAGLKHPKPKPKPLPRPGETRQVRGARYGQTTLSAENVKELLHSFDPPEA